MRKLPAAYENQDLNHFTAPCVTLLTSSIGKGCRIIVGSMYHSVFGERIMQMNMQLEPLIALIAGILILTVPRLLSWIVGIYLIIIGLLGIFAR
jgi:hypothetical protein